MTDNLSQEREILVYPEGEVNVPHMNDTLPIPISVAPFGGRMVQVRFCVKNDSPWSRHYHTIETGMAISGEWVTTVHTYSALKNVLPNHHLVAGRNS